MGALDEAWKKEKIWGRKRKWRTEEGLKVFKAIDCSLLISQRQEAERRSGREEREEEEGKTKEKEKKTKNKKEEWVGTAHMASSHQGLLDF